MNNIRRYLGYVTCLLISLAVTAVVAEETGARRYALPDHGSIQLNVPASWRDEIRQPPNRLPPTIVFKQRAGKPFDVLMTPIWPPKKDTSPLSAERMRQQVEQVLEHAKPQAVEKMIEVRELRGPVNLGYYFSATDRAPGPGEYKYMTQGMTRVGDLLVTFTILTNDGQGDIVNDALTMLKSAMHVNNNAA